MSVFERSNAHYRARFDYCNLYKNERKNNLNSGKMLLSEQKKGKFEPFYLGNVLTF